MVDGNFHISAYFSYNAHCWSIRLEIFSPIQAISGKSICLAVSILLTKSSLNTDHDPDLVFSIVPTLADEPSVR